jgi:AraC-like DNA-binding protein
MTKMPFSEVRRFTDPDDYAAAIRQGAAQVTVTARGRFAAQLIRIDLHRLWMQRLSENVARIKHTDGRGGRAVIAFPTHPDTSQSWNGIELHPSSIIRHREGGGYYQRSTVAASYAAMSLPLADIASVGAALAGCDLTPPRDAQIITPPPAAMAKLQRLHASAGQLADTAPEVIAQPEAARGLEQALVEAMVGCLAAGDTFEERAAQRRHRLIMRRFHQVIEERSEQPLYVPEICKAIGVAGRTLRLCCQEQLGTSPKHYLMVRRMHLARRDLSRSNTGATTVTEIASRHGFWQFGQFAGVYRSLFGELPSATLARPPEDRPTALRRPLMP